MTQHLSLAIADSPDVLVRVLTTLRRRGCVIVAVDYRVGDRHRGGRLEVTYEPPARCAGAVSAWLGNLVEVTAVTSRGSAPGR
jgi:acetolactate synthase regulatory subunit